ncbi:MAG: DUF5683 domain-containing protein [Salinivirgaceae bacterium]
MIRANKKCILPKVCPLIILFLFISFKGSAQLSSDYYQSDSSFLKTHSPLKATFMSALLPGLGQIYNQKYWKTPIIYAGFTGLLYYANYNNFVYNKYKDAYDIKIRINEGEDLEDPYPGAGENNMLRQKETWRRYRDLMYISIGLLYVAQIIDANVDANLFDFDMSEDLSFHVEPVLIPSPLYNNNWSSNASFGVRCAIQF